MITDILFDGEFLIRYGTVVRENLNQDFCKYQWRLLSDNVRGYNSSLKIGRKFCWLVLCKKNGLKNV